MKSNFMTMKKAIPAALLIAGTMGLSSNASASAYAVSYNNVFNLQVTSTDQFGGGGPFFVPLSAFDTFVATSQSGSAMSINGGAPTFGNGFDAQGGPADAGIAIATGSVFPGAAPANNDMTQQGQGGIPGYSYSDAQVSRTTLAQSGPNVVLNDVQTQAWAIAEGYIDANGSAGANARNSSETGFSTTFEVPVGTTDAIFNFDFNAAAFLEAAISLDAGVPSSANAAMSVVITISDNNNGGAPVFSWSPNGEAGGITGGTENLDPFSLNESVEVTDAGANNDYNPDGGAAPNSDVSPGAFGMFSASTDVLDAGGSYTLSIDMTNLINVTTNSVPQPGVLALMGLGLAGLGFSRRRKAS